MRWHSFTVEALVDTASSARLVERHRLEGLLIALAELVGPGQSAYDPQVVVMDSEPGGGASGSCLFPGGHVVVHTWAGAGRLPGRYQVEITSGEPVEAPAVLATVERRMGTPTDHRAASVTRGWRT